jgi:membrane-bound inhibitor of C-type lysozyme
LARGGDGAILRGNMPSRAQDDPMRCTAALLVALTLAGCASSPSKEEQEAARNTFACQLQGDRMVIRFEPGEARMLMPTGERVILYQIPAASGLRFSNGNLELRGKGTELTLIDNGSAVPLTGCAPYTAPK